MKAAEQVLDLYERFAEARGPISPAELARRLGMAPSSCFNLVRTFERRGFIYSTGARRALYPTKRMQQLAGEIARYSPVGSDMLGELEALRDRTGETVVLASRLRDRVVYLDVFEGPHRIRYSAQVGETRPVQANSMGKALLSLLPKGERAALVQLLTFEKLTAKTCTDREAFLAEIEASSAQGWFLNDGESVEDVLAIAAPLVVFGDEYAVTLAGPRYRLADRIAASAAEVKKACAAILAKGAARPAA